MSSETFNPCSDDNIRILVMDDEKYIRKLSQKMLEKFGYSVVLAADGQEAVEQYQKALHENNPFHLVIMDLTIPEGMGGKEASKEILGLDPRASIIVSSGYSNDPVMEDYEKYGLRGIIPKPYRIAELKKTIDQIINPEK